jgi:glycosidase
VREALPYLEELGVDCLWLSPLGPSPSYHRYDQTDYFDVDADLGGIAAARRLVADAHERGIRLILDFVPAHGSWLMPQFRAAQSDAGSEYRSWFIFDEWPHRYRSFLGVSPFLVTFNTADPGLRRFVTDSALFWVGDVGFDGLRLDHAIGAGSDFWVGFGDELQRARPDVTMLGEATDTPPMLRRYRGTLQGILDFPLANQLRMAFGTGELDAAAFGSALAAYMSFMGEGPDRVTFLDNHDMDRFLFVAGGDTRRLELAALCLFTLPHTPVIYYGTEVGLSQEVAKSDSGYGGDHHARSDMPWDSDAWDEGLRHTFRSLIALRKANPALRRGSWSLLTDTPPGVVGYRLTLDEATCDVFLNLSDEPRSVGAGGRLLAGVGGSAAGDGAVVLAPLGGVVVGGP